MAILANKFHIKQNDTIYECNCYTLSSEATPVSGDFWEIKNNGVTCYLGLQIAGKTNYDTPLNIKKNDIVYSVQTQVVNIRQVIITQSEHQIITVICNGKEYTSDFVANVGDLFTVKVTPEVGYLAGTPNVSSGNIPVGETGYVIYASPATNNKYQVTILQDDNNQKIVVICNGINYIDSFQADYGATGNVIISSSKGYIAGTPNITSFTLTSNITISATPATRQKCIVSVTQPQNGNITVNGTKGTSFAIDYGSQVTIKANANNEYTVDALYVDELS